MIESELKMAKGIASKYFTDEELANSSGRESQWPLREEYAEFIEYILNVEPREKQKESLSKLKEDFRERGLDPSYL